MEKKEANLDYQVKKPFKRGNALLKRGTLAAMVVGVVRGVVLGRCWGGAHQSTVSELT